ncbi:MAG: ribosome assembly factor SBDS [archaeon]
MISLDDAVIARYAKGELSFEILVDPEKARQFKQGEIKSLDDVIASPDIFTDLKEGKKAPDADLNKAFGTTNVRQAMAKIIEKGEIQLTTEQKRRMQENRRKQLVALIAREAVDPRTHVPHPAVRIEKALEEARIHVDPFKSAEAQVEAALKAIKPIIPIKMERVRVAIRVPPQYAGPACGFMKAFHPLKEQWGNDGSFMCMVEIPAGLKPDLLDKLSRLTHGEVESKVTETL